MTRNDALDWFFDKAEKWQPEMRALRSIVLGCNLTEILKWGCPCYALENQNVVLIHGFKNYCALLFFKGALLTDAAGMLIQQTVHVQAARQLRFAGMEEITAQQTLITAYVLEAIEIEKGGKTVPLKPVAELAYPLELEQKITEMPGLQAAFDALTPGRKRAYLIYFSGPKKSETRNARIEKCIPQIFEGKGLHD